LAHSQGRKDVFTNGCFDLLRAGYVHLLQRARALGHILMVAINDDASVREIKVKERPLIPRRVEARIFSSKEGISI